MCRLSVIMGLTYHHVLQYPSGSSSSDLEAMLGVAAVVVVVVRPGGSDFQQQVARGVRPRRRRRH